MSQDETHERDSRYARELGERLRRVRIQQGRSLQDVEDRSGGKLKASVVGAYERGERAVSIARLHALADHYRVPVQELLPDAERDTGGGPGAGQVTIDLVALEEHADEQPALVRYVASIQSRRGDYNGRVLTVRSSDLDALAAVLDAGPTELRTTLEEVGIVR
ncbi:transcriptional regulator [Nitriliruptoraceae bacterium ZYF776]|nr:transcriptional regulator [Profundirhabdus halotolerans]